MNCREAEPLLFAARDGALDESQRAALAKHVGECASCRQAGVALDQATDAWRAGSAAVPTPRVEGEWRAIRERIRGDEPGSVPIRAWLRPLVAGATALAAFAIVAWLGRGFFQPESSTPGRNWTYVSYVTVETPSDATMVFEDPDSGWLVVWVGDTSEAGT